MAGVDSVVMDSRKGIEEGSGVLVAVVSGLGVLVDDG